jgi:hypothetical protein
MSIRALIVTACCVALPPLGAAPLRAGRWSTKLTLLARPCHPFPKVLP